MTDSVTFRTTDLTRWGTGQNSRLTKSTIDINFWVLLSRVITLEGSVAAAVIGIDTFFISPTDPTQFYVVMTDHTQLGPYTLPQITWNFTGNWQSLSLYNKFDVFTDNGSLYQANSTFTSAATFDPNATDGGGNNLYTLLLAQPSINIPSGGFAGQVLAKKSDTDYDTQWQNESTLAIKTVSSSTYTLVTGDIGKCLRFTNAPGCTVTLPATLATTAGDEIEMRDCSTVTTGGLSIATSGGATINGIYGTLNQTAAYGGTIGLKNTSGASNWDIAGYLARL